MKRLFVLILALVLCCSSASASSVDLSGMTFDELVALRDQLNLAIWNCQEWQEITVPEGVYQVGVDIPSGHWSVRAVYEKAYFYITVFDNIDILGKGPKNCTVYWDSDIRGSGRTNDILQCPLSVDVVLYDGLYVKLTGDAVFTPYAGKPDLGFH